MQLYYPDEPSVLQAEMLVEWKRKQGLYNFTNLPSTAMICMDPVPFRSLKTFYRKRLLGLKGNHFVRNKILFSSGVDNGAPGIINLLEELRALQVSRFIFVGLAGILTKGIGEGESYSVKTAISALGAVSSYSGKNHLEACDPAFFNKIRTGLGVPDTNCFSVDTPFRETRPLLNQAIEAGAMLIEMECAAVYAFSQFYKLPAICLLTAADDLTGAWKSPERWSDLRHKQGEVIRKIISILS